ncbi:MAG TPA: phosphatase PAP2 family protein [Casimicrobiaceae bacterium]|jgi:membrane-associated phospholipid phosphatase
MIDVRRWRMSRAYAAWLLLPLAVAAVILATGVNVTAFQAVQSASHVVPQPLFEAFWQSVTYAGDGLAVFTLGALMLWHRPNAAWAGLVAAIPGSIALRALKMVLPVDRPALVLMHDGVTVLGPALHHGSFPSGHSLAAGILAGIVFLAYRSPVLRTVAMLAALLVAVSRAVVGVHWPLDIAVGLGLGWICAWIGWQLVGDAQWTRMPRARALVSAIIAGCALALFFHPVGLPAAAPFRYALAAIGVVLAALSLARAVRDWRTAPA